MILVCPSLRLNLLCLFDGRFGPVGCLVDDVGRVLEHRLALAADGSEQVVQRVADPPVAADVVPVVPADRAPYVVHGGLELVHGLVHHLLGRGHGAPLGHLQPSQRVIAGRQFGNRFGRARLEAAEHGRRVPGRGPRTVERLRRLLLDAVHHARHSVHQRRRRCRRLANATAAVSVIAPCTGGCGRRVLRKKPHENHDSIVIHQSGASPGFENVAVSTSFRANKSSTSWDFGIEYRSFLSILCNQLEQMPNVLGRLL